MTGDIGGLVGGQAGDAKSPARVQDPVHDLSACSDDGAQLVAADEFCCCGAVCPARRAISSMGMPSADTRETKV